MERMERAAVNLPYGCTKGVGRVGCGGRCEPGRGRRPGLGVEAPAVETTQQPTRRRFYGSTRDVGRVGCGGRCEPGGGRRPGLGVEAPAEEMMQQPTRRRSHRFASAGRPLRLFGGQGVRGG
jgi:hypothetical protein